MAESNNLKIGEVEEAHGRKVEPGNNGGDTGTDTLLSELTTLKVKLEKLMEHDFKKQEQAKLRKEVLSSRMSKPNQQNLENASRLREEAVRLSERWRQHSASDPTGLRSDDSGQGDSRGGVQSDSNVSRMAPIFEREAPEDHSEAAVFADELAEASDIMADVHLKYEQEELWLRQRMEQLKREAEEIEQFKARLERGRQLWEGGLFRLDLSGMTTSQSSSGSYSVTLDEQERLRPDLATDIDQGHFSNPLAEQQLAEELQQGRFDKEMWAKFIGSIGKYELSVFRVDPVPSAAVSGHSSASERSNFGSDRTITIDNLAYSDNQETDNNNQYRSIDPSIDQTSGIDQSTATSQSSGSDQVKLKSIRETAIDTVIVGSDQVPDHVDIEESQPIITEKTALPAHPALRAVDQMPSLPEQLHESDSDLSLITRSILSIPPHYKECRDVDEEVVLNVNFVATEIDFFCDSTLRETIIPVLRADATSSSSDLTELLRGIAIESEFLWKLTTSRQSSEHGTPSSTSTSRRASNAQSIDDIERRSAQIDNGDGSAVTDVIDIDHVLDRMADMVNDNLISNSNITDATPKIDDSALIIRPEKNLMEKGNLDNGQVKGPADANSAKKFEQQNEQSICSLLDYQSDQNAIREEAHGNGIFNKHQELNKNYVTSLDMLNDRLNELKKSELAPPSIGTSVETMDTVGSNGSSNGQRQKRTLAETVQATHQLRKQLSDIVSTYDREVTYLLLSVENYRQQWRKESYETQKQLNELRKNMKKLEYNSVPRKLSNNSTDAVSSPPKPVVTIPRKKSPLSVQAKDKPKLKQYNPDIELPVGKEKLSELNRQLFELHMKLSNGESGGFDDKEKVRGMVTQILKQLLEIRADPEEKRAFLESIPPNVAAAAYRESSRDAVGSDSNLSTTAPTIFSDPQGPYGIVRKDGSIADQICKHDDQADITYHIMRKDSTGLNSDASFSQYDQSIFEQRKESVRLSVNLDQGHHANRTLNDSSITAYIIPHPRESGLLRRSRSAEDLKIKQAILQKEAENEDRGGIQSAEEEGGDQKALKLLADRSVISVSCEKKRSKSFEAASFHRASKISDDFSIHEWAAPDLPRYVSDGEASKVVSIISPTTVGHTVNLASKQPQIPANNAPWTKSPISDSSIDSGLGLHTETESSGKTTDKNAIVDTNATNVQEAFNTVLATNPADCQPCHIHLHRYSVDGPAEFCRRSRSQKRSASIPTRTASTQAGSSKSILADLASKTLPTSKKRSGSKTLFSSKDTSPERDPASSAAISSDVAISAAPESRASVPNLASDPPTAASRARMTSSASRASLATARSSSLTRRTPSPGRSKLAKPIEMTDVGDAVLAMGIQLTAVVMSPSKSWTDMARSFVATSFTDKFKRAVNYHKKLQQTRSRSNSAAPSAEAPSEIMNKDAMLPPKYRRTVSERQVEMPPLPTLNIIDDEGKGIDSNFDTKSGKKSSVRKMDEHATHRTRSEADVFSAKKKGGLKWKDSTWTYYNRS